MAADFTEHELEAYLDETLDPTRAAELEKRAASDSDLLRRLANINSRRNAGVHTLGEIWRRNQIGVPSREMIEAWVDQRLDQGAASYIEFRVNILKCRYTQALIADVRQAREAPQIQGRRNRQDKLFKKGAELLSRRKPRK